MEDPLAAAARALRLGDSARHIFLCATPTTAKCVGRERGEAAWAFLKRRLREVGLAGPQRLVHRSKADCLRVCVQGPIAVIYPEGRWYHSCTEENLERIIQSDLLRGVPIPELLIAPPQRGSIPTSSR